MNFKKHVSSSIKTISELTKEAVDKSIETSNKMKEKDSIINELQALEKVRPKDLQDAVDKYIKAVDVLTETYCQTIKFKKIIYDGIESKTISTIDSNQEWHSIKNTKLENIMDNIAKGGAVITGAAFATLYFGGTASTGVAISSLSAPYAINAILAKLGGGTIAAGGLGILGGIGMLSILIGTGLAYSIKKINSYNDKNMDKFRKKTSLYYENYSKIQDLTNMLNYYINQVTTLNQLLQYAPNILYNNEPNTLKHYSQYLHNEVFDLVTMFSHISFILGNKDKIDESDIQNSNKVNMNDVLAELNKYLDDVLMTLYAYKFNTKNTCGSFAPSEYLLNEAIIDEFYSIIDNTEKELHIVSPWISKEIHENNTGNGGVLYRKLLEAKKRNVKIHITYGIGLQQNRLMHSNFAAQKLEKSLSPNIKIDIRNTHEKIVISDNSIVLIGSLNYLSFLKYTEADKRDEIAVKMQATPEFLNKIKRIE